MPLYGDKVLLQVHTTLGNLYYLYIFLRPFYAIVIKRCLIAQIQIIYRHFALLSRFHERHASCIHSYKYINNIIKTIFSDLELTVGTTMTDKQYRVNVSKEVIQRQPVPPEHVLRPHTLLVAINCRRDFTSVSTRTS